MANRAERRAQAKANRRGVPSQYDQTQGRGRSGMIDEYQLQQKAKTMNGQICMKVLQKLQKRKVSLN